MFCKNCGSKLDDDAVFCEKCGTAIKRTASLDLAKDSTTQESSSSNQISNELTNENSTAAVTKPKKQTDYCIGCCSCCNCGCRYFLCAEQINIWRV